MDGSDSEDADGCAGARSGGGEGACSSGANSSDGSGGGFDGDEEMLEASHSARPCGRRRDMTWRGEVSCGRRPLHIWQMMK